MQLCSYACSKDVKSRESLNSHHYSRLPAHCRTQLWANIKAGHIVSQTPVTTSPVSWSPWSPNCFGISAQWISKQKRPARAVPAVPGFGDPNDPSSSKSYQYYSILSMADGCWWSATLPLFKHVRLTTCCRGSEHSCFLSVCERVCREAIRKSLHPVFPVNHPVAPGISIGSGNSKKWATCSFSDVEWGLNDSHNMIQYEYIYIYMFLLRVYIYTYIYIYTYVHYVCIYIYISIT